VTPLEAFRRDYRVAFLHYLPRREEAALLQAYELGRAAVIDGLSILDLARVHHDILVEALRNTPAHGDEVASVAEAAAEFLLEALAPYEMAHRGFRESL
jgi:hypothetical protein